MFFKSTINARKDGLSGALKMKEDVNVLSAKSVNKLLQILYDDLIDVNNTVYSNRTGKALPGYNIPAAFITKNLVIGFIERVGERDHDGNLVAEENRYYDNKMLDPKYLRFIRGFGTCQFLVGKMLSRCLFVNELTKAKTLLHHSSFLQTDPGRNEILGFIIRLEEKAQQQKMDAIHAAMTQMHNMRLFRHESMAFFSQSVNDYLVNNLTPGKAELKMKGDNSLSVKRSVKHFHAMSTSKLKEKIETILADNTDSGLLKKEMSLWDKLVEIRDDVVCKTGDSIILYYTGKGADLNWCTKEECAANGHPTINPTSRIIPTDNEYLTEVNKLCAKYNQQQLAINNRRETFS